MESDSFVQKFAVLLSRQIEPAKDAMRMEEVDKPFSMAFAQVCALKEVQRLFCPTKTCDICRGNWACKRIFEHGKINPKPQQGVR